MHIVCVFNAIGVDAKALLMDGANLRGGRNEVARKFLEARSLYRTLVSCM